MKDWYTELVSVMLLPFLVEWEEDFRLYYVTHDDFNWPNGQRAVSSAKMRASGNGPYNVSTAQNTEGTRHFLTFYGFQYFTGFS